MPTHQIQASVQPGYLQVTDMRTGTTQLVFVGQAAARLGRRDIRPQREAPSQKWGAVIAA